MKLIYQENSLLQALNLKFTQSEYVIFNYFFNRARSRAIINISAITIALQKNVSRKTVQRAVDRFISLGFMKKITPKYNKNNLKTCTYIINTSLFQFADQFKHKFQSFFKYLSVRAIKLWYANVPQYPTGILKEPSITITKESKKSPVFNTRGLKKQKEQEIRELMEISPPKISDTLREITDKLRLNKLGQLKLLVFQESILAEAWNDFKKVSSIRHPFDYLVANCVQKSENRNIPVYWDLFYTACNRYGLKDTKKYVQEKVVVSSVVRSINDENRLYKDITKEHLKSNNPFLGFLELALQNMDK